MTATMKAIYEGGLLRPLAPLELREGQEVDMIVSTPLEAIPPDPEAVENFLTQAAVLYQPTGQTDATSVDHDKIRVLREMEKTAPDPRKAAEILAEIAAMSVESPDGPERGSVDHDKILYGEHGAR